MKLNSSNFLVRSALNGYLVQDADMASEGPEHLVVKTALAPSEQEIQDLLFANKLVKHAKSNTIILAKNDQLLASGTGQTSRVDALKQAIHKAESFAFLISKVQPWPAMQFSFLIVWSCRT